MALTPLPLAMLLPMPLSTPKQRQKQKQKQKPMPQLLACLVLLCLSLPARGQLPLSIEALLVSDQRLSATFRVGRDSHREPQLLAGPGGVALGWRELTLDHSSAGLRYGLSPRLELNTRYERSELQWDLAGAASGDNRSERLVLGANWLAWRGGAGSLLLEAQLDALARPLGGTDGWQAVSAGSLGATWYRPLDPVVLSVAGRYRYERVRSTALGDLRPAPTATLDASVSFALNRQVTLLGGLALVHRGDDRLGARGSATADLRASLAAGIAYAPLPSTTAFLRARVPVGASDGDGGLTAELLYEF